MIKSYDEFLTAIEGYYGIKYTSNLELKFLDVFLKPRLERLDDLFMKVISTHSKKWKSLPDIAIYYAIEKEEREKHIEFDAEKSWSMLIGISESDNMLIRDPYIYGSISGYGNWSQFCEQRDSNREWTHKDFNRRYKLMREMNLPENEKILVGWTQLQYGENGIGVKTRELSGSIVKNIGHELPKELVNCIKRMEAI